MSWPDGLLGTHRLSLFGIDVGGRADQLAADIELLVDDPVYLFNDWYAVMALGLSGRHECNQQLVANNRRRTVGTNREVAERVRLALVEGFGSFAAASPTGPSTCSSTSAPWPTPSVAATPNATSST